MNINLSVIVPIYGVEKYIEQCAVSLFEQSLKDIEFIFVNDQTKDNSVKILEAVIDRYEHLKNRIKIINHQKNMGQAAARTTGLGYAKGEYIIHLDSDDWVDLNLYQKMYFQAKTENADIVCCNFKFIYKSSVDELKFKQNQKDFLDLNELNFDLLYSSLCNKMVKRELYLKNNLSFFEGVNMWEDLGMMTRLRYHCKKVSFLDENLFYNYNKQNETSIVSVPKEENIIQQIKCANMLDEFFREKLGDYSLIICFLKFMAKSDYLFNDKIRNIKKWQATSKESNLYIFKYSKLPLNMKFIAWVAAKNYIFLANIMFFIKKKLLSVNK